jgi:hypothetical protein
MMSQTDQLDRVLAEMDRRIVEAVIRALPQITLADGMARDEPGTANVRVLLIPADFIECWRHMAARPDPLLERSKPETAARPGRS